MQLNLPSREFEEPPMGLEVYQSTNPPRPAPMVLLNDMTTVTAMDVSNPSRTLPVGGAMVQKAVVYPSRNPSLYFIKGNRLFRRQLCKLKWAGIMAVCWANLRWYNSTVCFNVSQVCFGHRSLIFIHGLVRCKQIVIIIRFAPGPSYPSF